MTKPGMEDKEAVSSLSDLAERLFSKPPSVQVSILLKKFLWWSLNRNAFPFYRI